MRNAVAPRILGCLLAVFCAGTGCAHRPWDRPDAAWTRFSAPHFVVHSDAEMAQVQPLVERLERVHAALGRRYFMGASTPVVEVLAFRRPSDYKGVAPDDVAGFFVDRMGPLGQGLMVFPMDSDFDLVASIAAHELAHRFLSGIGPHVPPWLHEGFANYVGALQIEGDLVIFDAEEIHGGYVYFADPVPMNDLLTAKFSGFHSADGMAHYMTSWILMRRLLSESGNGRQQHFEQFVRRIEATQDVNQHKQIVAEVFGLKLPELDRDIKAFHSSVFHGIGKVRSRKTGAVVLPDLGPLNLQVAPDDPGDVKAMCLALRK